MRLLFNSTHDYHLVKDLARAITKEGEDELLEDLDGEIDEDADGGQLGQVKGEAQPAEEDYGHGNQVICV